MSAHGQQPCQMRSTESEKILDSYQSALANHDTEKVEELNKIFGSKKLAEMVGERATLELIKQTTMIPKVLGRAA